MEISIIFRPWLIKAANFQVMRTYTSMYMNKNRYEGECARACICASVGMCECVRERDCKKLI